MTQSVELTNSTEKLINTKQTQSLVDLFTEFDKFSEFEKLIESAKSSFIQFEINYFELFQLDNQEKARSKIHLLKNKFNNLGMMHSVSILDRLKGTLGEAITENNDRDQLFFQLKRSVLNSFNFIFEKYLD